MLVQRVMCHVECKNLQKHVCQEIYQNFIILSFILFVCRCLSFNRLTGQIPDSIALLNDLSIQYLYVNLFQILLIRNYYLPGTHATNSDSWTCKSYLLSYTCLLQPVCNLETNVLRSVTPTYNRMQVSESQFIDWRDIKLDFWQQRKFVSSLHSFQFNISSRFRETTCQDG